MSEPTEVFEVVERFSGRRAMEHVHLTAQAALDWIENGIPAKDHGKYRAQSVKVYALPPVSSGEAEPACGSVHPNGAVACMLPPGHDHEHAWFTEGDGVQWPADAAPVSSGEAGTGD